MKYVFTFVLAPVYLDHLECLLADWQHTMLRRNCGWSMGDLRGRKKNLGRLNEGSPITEQFATHTVVPAYLVISYFYWHTNHLISVDPCLPSPSDDCLSGLAAKTAESEQAHPLPAADRASICTWMSRKKLIKTGWWGKDRALSWQRKASGLFGLINRRASGQLLGKDWSTILLNSPSMIDHAPFPLYV